MNAQKQKVLDNILFGTFIVMAIYLAINVFAGLVNRGHVLNNNDEQIQEWSYHHEGCTPDMPAYSKPWKKTGQEPCDWAGYDYDNEQELYECNMYVMNCQI